jgi:NFU1 iron-sulfur cluster scaffold homolog, mitochondrial
VTDAFVPRAHVERTDDPAVMRWVCDHPALAAAGTGSCDPPRTSPLGELLARGSIARVAIASGDILVRAPDARDWDAIAPLVHDAVIAELRAGAHALADTTRPAPPAAPSTAAIVAIVDRAVGPLAAAHGGRVEVVEVGAASVVLRLHGACRGCQSENTTADAAAAAIRREYPQMREITVHEDQAGHEHRSRRLPIPLMTRRDKRSGPFSG